MKDYYQILDVPKEATPEAIKKAYRAKALEFHPDVNPDPNSEDRFLEIQVAYDVLSNAEKRAGYDQAAVIIPIRVQRQRKYPPPQAFKERKSSFGMFEGANVVMEYHRYMRTARVIGLVSFLFALTFLVDYLFHNEQSVLEVTAVKSKALITNKSDDTKLVVVTAGNYQFDKRREVDNELQVGQQIDLKSSLLYGYKEYRIVGEPRFIPATVLANMVRFVALLIYLTSLTAIFTQSRPELKFNAALVSAFFSLALLAFVLLT